MRELNEQVSIIFLYDIVFVEFIDLLVFDVILFDIFVLLSDKF